MILHLIGNGVLRLLVFLIEDFIGSIFEEELSSFMMV